MQIINYALIVLTMVLLGIAGLQFSYMFYVDRLNRERRDYLRQLERRAKNLKLKLDAAEEKVAEQHALLERFVPEYMAEDDAWADVIDDR